MGFGAACPQGQAACLIGQKPPQKLGKAGEIFLYALSLLKVWVVIDDMSFPCQS